jgi:hypothetical protein
MSDAIAVQEGLRSPFGYAVAAVRPRSALPVPYSGDPRLRFAWADERLHPEVTYNRSVLENRLARTLAGLAAGSREWAHRGLFVNLYA